MFSEPYGVIYQIAHRVNGKRYIGQTTADPDRYWQGHVNASRKGHKKVLYNAMRKHGVDLFSFEVIFTAFDKETLDLAEDYFIVEGKTLIPFGYNMKGGGARGKFSDEMRRNHSLILKAILSSSDVRNRMSVAAKLSCQRSDILALKLAATNARWARPGEHERASVSSSEFLARPEVKAKRAETEDRIKGHRRAVTLAQFADPKARTRHSAITSELYGDPGYRERHRTAHNTPEFKEKMAAITERTAAHRSAVLSRKRWITDGTTSNFVDPDVSMPDGWHYGRVKSPALLASLVRARQARYGIK